MLSNRFYFSTGFFLVCLLLLISIYLQVFENMLPCPLCTLQRLSFVMLAILFGLSMLMANKNKFLILFKLLIIYTSLQGMVLAGRNIWLQHFPETNQGCSVDIQYLLTTFPFSEALQKIFSGSTDCSIRGFEFLFLDMAEWAFIWFFIFFWMTIYLLFRKPKY